MVKFNMPTILMPIYYSVKLTSLYFSVANCYNFCVYLKYKTAFVCSLIHNKRKVTLLYLPLEYEIQIRMAFTFLSFSS